MESANGKILKNLQEFRPKTNTKDDNQFESYKTSNEQNLKKESNFLDLDEDQKKELKAFFEKKPKSESFACTKSVSMKFQSANLTKSQISLMPLRHYFMLNHPNFHSHDNHRK